jgi:hypothetical protein
MNTRFGLEPLFILPCARPVVARYNDNIVKMSNLLKDMICILYLTKYV